MADDVGGALAHYPSQGFLHLPGKAGRVADDPAARPSRPQHRLSARQLGVKVGCAVAADDRSHLAQRLVRNPAHLEHALGGVIAAVTCQLRGELTLHRDQGEVPAEHVMQVAGEAQPFLGD